MFRGCSRDVKEAAYKSIVRPQLEYACSVWDPHQNYLIWELEGVQRRAARFVMSDFRQRSSVSKMIAFLGWEELNYRRQRVRLCNMFRIMRGEEAWSDLQKRLVIDEGFKGRRDHNMKLSLDFRRRNWGLYSFLGRGAREWNGLPREVVSPFPVSLASFRNRMQGCVGMAGVAFVA